MPIQIPQPQAGLNINTLLQLGMQLRQQRANEEYRQEQLEIERQNQQRYLQEIAERQRSRALERERFEYQRTKFTKEQEALEDMLERQSAAGEAAANLAYQYQTEKGDVGPTRSTADLMDYMRYADTKQTAPLLRQIQEQAYKYKTPEYKGELDTTDGLKIIEWSPATGLMLQDTGLAKRISPDKLSIGERDDRLIAQFEVGQLEDTAVNRRLYRAAKARRSKALTDLRIATSIDPSGTRSDSLVAINWLNASYDPGDGIKPETIFTTERERKEIPDSVRGKTKLEAEQYIREKDKLDLIHSMYKPEYLEFLNQGLFKLESVMERGIPGYESEDALMEFAQFRQLMEVDKNQYRHQITGAAAGFKEISLLMKASLHMGMSKSEFKGVIQSRQAINHLSRARLILFANATGKDPQYQYEDTETGEILTVTTKDFQDWVRQSDLGVTSFAGKTMAGAVQEKLNLAANQRIAQLMDRTDIQAMYDVNPEQAKYQIRAILQNEGFLYTPYSFEGR